MDLIERIASIKYESIRLKALRISDKQKKPIFRLAFFLVAAPDHLSNQIIQGYELVVDLYKYMNRSPD